MMWLVDVANFRPPPPLFGSCLHPCTIVGYSPYTLGAASIDETQSSYSSLYIQHLHTYPGEVRTLCIYTQEYSLQKIAGPEN